MIHFSAATLGFYDDRLHATIPADAVHISAKRHRALLDGQARGEQIVADAKGRPTLKAREALEPRAWFSRRLRREAARRIEAVSPVWRQLNDQRAPSPEGAARFAAIDAIRAASDAIEASVATMDSAALRAIDIVHHPLWPAD